MRISQDAELRFECPGLFCPTLFMNFNKLFDKSYTQAATHTELCRLFGLWLGWFIQGYKATEFQYFMALLTSSLALVSL